MDKIEKIETFIEQNNIDFTGSGSDLNGSYVVVIGYGLYLGLSEDELCEVIPDAVDQDDFERIFKCAELNDYGDWWEDEDNRKGFIL